MTEPRLRRYERDSQGRCWAVYTWMYDCPEGPEPQGSDYTGAGYLCQTCGGYGYHQRMFGRRRERVPEHDVEMPPLPALPGEQSKLF